MTPNPRAVEVLAEALNTAAAEVGRGWAFTWVKDVVPILAALPEGWTFIGPEEQAALADGLALAKLPGLFAVRRSPLQGRVFVIASPLNDPADWCGGPTFAAAAEAALAALEGRDAKA